MAGFLDAHGPIAFAHRGYARDGDENSLAAFQRAVDLGYRYVETDVRTTSDGVALAFHDNRLDRVTDGRGAVHTQPWSVVRRARIAGREPIPRLSEVLDAWPQLCLNLDVKADAGVRPVLDAIAAASAMGRVCLTGFADRRVAQLRWAAPEVVTGLGPRAVAALWTAARRGRPAPRQPGQCVQVPPRIGRLGVVDERFLDTAHAAGLVVHVWTVNDRTEMQRLLDLGVDGVMTDDAPLLRAVLMQRGHWPTG
jgi:glycerophosphoryl diester phosphodiesterase